MTYCNRSRELQHDVRKELEKSMNQTWLALTNLLLTYHDQILQFNPSYIFLFEASELSNRRMIIDDFTRHHYVTYRYYPVAAVDTGC